MGPLFWKMFLPEGERSWAMQRFIGGTAVWQEQNEAVYAAATPAIKG